MGFLCLPGLTDMDKIQLGPLPCGCLYDYTVSLSATGSKISTTVP
jgi:hypothetical protein